MRSTAVLPLVACFVLSACSVNPTDKRTAGGDGELVHADIGPSLETAEILRRQRTADYWPRSQSRPVDRDTTEAVSAPQDMWDRLRDGFAMPEVERAAVGREMQRYTDMPEYLGTVGERARPFLHYIAEKIDARDLPMELALIPVIESAYKSSAYSRGHAAGLWQFVPTTADHFGLQRNWWYDGRRDLVASTEAALDYFAYLNDYFDGDWLLTIAAYNAGEGTVKRAIERNASRGQPTDFWHLDLPAQTEAYVPRLLAVRDLIAEPEAHGITLPEIPNERAIRTVELEGQIDLSLAAELAGISTDALYRLNPGYNRWATPPEGPHRLVVPAQRAERFRQGLAARAPSERMRWQRHEVARGDTLGEIADRYHTSVAMLRDLNDLNGNLIRVGDELVVPASGRPVQGQRLAGRGGGGERALQHEVQPGDSLWAVARRYDVTVDQLVAWNQLSPDTVLQPGDTLRIRQGGEAGGAGQSVYTVRKGDSLYRIAREFDVRVADLRRWNGIDRGDYLRPGQQLQVQAR